MKLKLRPRSGEWSVQQLAGIKMLVKSLGRQHDIEIAVSAMAVPTIDRPKPPRSMGPRKFRAITPVSASNG
jgi:hypothetical protein